MLLRIHVKWNNDELEYGYLLERRADGSSWHLHFGRANDARYHCKLLKHETIVFASVSKLTPRKRPPPSYILTLDGEYINEKLRLNYDWGKKANVPGLIAEARHFQQKIMPILFKSQPFHSAVWEYVLYQRRLREAAPEKLVRG